ncbi:MAG: PIG-L family deacetylase [Candidatus Limnocylindrales bacterium]
MTDLFREIRGPELCRQAFTGPPVTHLFVAPHPDDVALSCGGLVARLRKRGESVGIATVYSGAGSRAELTPYQRQALGFGERRGSLAPADVMRERAAEDAAYAVTVGARLFRADEPDAVFRGYEGEDQLMGPPRPDDLPPYKCLEAALDSLRPAVAYLPLAVGGHVDHRLVHQAGIIVLGGGRYPHGGIPPKRHCQLVFYEDLPYAAVAEFHSLEQLRPDQLAGLSPWIRLVPECVELSGDLADRKLAGIRAYASQIDRLFGSDAEMAAVIRARAVRVGTVAGTEPAERYWRATAP